ncbi:MAG: MMPL family transporter [bacterium]|nr:MMPL family transporter [bacterium]
MNRLIDLLEKNYRYFFIVIIVLTLPFGYYFSKQKFFNNVEVFFEKDAPVISDYTQFKEKYGNEETAVIAFEDANLFTNENITLIRTVTDAITEIPGVQRVFSITNSEIMRGAKDQIIFEPMVPEGSLSEAELLKAKQNILDTRYARNRLISRDGTMTAIQVELDSFKDDSQKRDVLKSIRAKANKLVGNTIKTSIAGLPFLEMDMNELSEKDFTVLIPLVFILIFFIVFMLIKDIKLSLLCMVNLLFCLTWGIGMISLSGEPFNIVTTVIPVIILAISVADTIHIITHYKEKTIQNGISAENNGTALITASVKSLWLPCLLTTITTGIGFFSFFTSTVRPVKILGIFTGIAILFAYMLTIFFLPSLLFFFKKKVSSAHTRKKNKKEKALVLTPFLAVMGTASAKYSKSLSALAVVIVILGIVGINKITYETNIVNFFPESNQTRIHHKHISEKFVGTVPLVLLLKAKSGENDFTHPESIELVDAIQRNTFDTIQNISNSFSIADYYKEMNQAFNDNNKKYYSVPETREKLVEFYELGDLEILDRIISPDKMEIRVAAQMKLDTDTNAQKLIDRISNYTKTIAGDSYTCTITGIAPIYIKMQSNLKESQIRSFAAAFVIISFMMIFICRNIYLALFSIIVNLFPITITLGVMGWLGIPLDVSTIMIASITMGIAVDDTIHFVTWFKRHIHSGLPLREAIERTVLDAGKPIAVTTIVLFLSFFLFIFGSLSSTRAFGVLTAFSMVLAFLGDLVILPALLSLVKYKK